VNKNLQALPGAFPVALSWRKAARRMDFQGWLASYDFRVPADIFCRYNLAEVARSYRNIFLTSGYQEKYNEVFDKKQGTENLNQYFFFHGNLHIFLIFN